MSRRKKEMPEEIPETTGKKSALLVVAIILLAGIGGALGYWVMQNPSGIDYDDDTGEEVPDGPYAPGTHMIMAELFVTPASEDCAAAERDMASMEDERSDFYFVSMVADPYNVNMDVIYRFQQIGNLNGTAPDAEFDGGRRSVVGNLGGSAYAEAIDESKDVPVPAVSMEGEAQLYGNTVVRGSVDIDVGEDFDGYIRAFVIEKRSTTMFNTDDEPIPNAFLGYASNESVHISSSSTYHLDMQWEGDNLSADNTAIIVALYDQRGYSVQAYRMEL